MRQVAVLFATIVLTILVFVRSPTAQNNPSRCDDVESLRSSAASQSISITFENQSSEAVDIKWIDYNGRQNLYKSLASGGTYVQQTYVTHAWLVTGQNGACRIAFSAAGPSLVIIGATANSSFVSWVSQATPQPAAPQVAETSNASNQIYDKQSGIWGTPSCDSGSEYVIAVSDLYMTFDTNGGLWRVNLFKPVTHRFAGKYLIEEYKSSENQYPVSYSWFDGDDLLSAWTQAFSTQQDLSRQPDSPPSSLQIFTSKRCDRLPPDVYLLFAEGIKYMQLASIVKDKCTADGGDCLKSVFAFVDVSGDKRLSVAEIARAIRIFTFAAVAANPQGASQQDIAGALSIAMILGPPIASAIINGSDYDGDGQLSLDELFYDRDLTSVQRAMMGMGHSLTLEATGKLMEAIFQGLSKLPGLF
jgi:hypothetical protein